jgi:hypothetical protein
MLFGRLVGCLAGITLDTCWVAVALASCSWYETTELFWRAEVQVIYNDVARVAVWNLHPALPGCELRFVMVTCALLATRNQTRTIECRGCSFSFMAVV